MSAIQNAAAGTAAASFVASQIGNSIAGTFGMGYAKLVVGQAAWAASVGALGEKMANGTATGGDYANVIQKTGDLLLGLGLTIAQVNPWIRGAFTIASGGLFIYDNWDKISDFYDRAKTWVWPRDPIILDLDGDGLETVGLASNVYFDHDGDGVLTKTGWAGANDALLVWDRNGNGTIDTGAELFGDFTVLPNGTLAPNGFAALAALDANGDGVIDATDPAFAELKLWRDISQDGVSQGGELVSLADAGIVSLNLAHSLKNQRLANGNTLAREGTFTRADGSTSAMGEFKLAIDTFDTRFAEEIEVPEALRVLPNMQGGATCANCSRPPPNPAASPVFSPSFRTRARAPNKKPCSINSSPPGPTPPAWPRAWKSVHRANTASSMKPSATSGVVAISTPRPSRQCLPAASAAVVCSCAKVGAGGTAHARMIRGGWRHEVVQLHSLFTQTCDRNHPRLYFNRSTHPNGELWRRQVL